MFQAELGLAADVGLLQVLDEHDVDLFDPNELEVNARVDEEGPAAEWWKARGYVENRKEVRAARGRSRERALAEMRE